MTGIPVPTLSEYESGSRRFDKSVRSRIEASVGMTPDSVILRHGLVTFPAVTRSIRRYLREGDPSFAFRALRQTYAYSRLLESDADVAVFFADPGFTGHSGWNAMVAGIADMAVSELGAPYPEWTAGDSRFLGKFWAPFGSKYHYMYLPETPAELLGRGVVLARRELSYV